MELAKSLIVEYERNEEMEKLLEDFRDMVNFCIEKGLEYGYSLKKLHQNCYCELKKRYNYSAYIIASSYRVAQSIIRSWKANKGKEKPVARKKLIRLHKSIFKIDLENDRLVINYKPGKKIFLKLKLSGYHKEQIKKASKIGEVLVNERCVYIPLAFEIDLTNPNKFVAIDVNENSIAFASSDGKAGKIETGIREIKVGYMEKRRKIQKIRNGRKRKELLRKYSEREQNRTKDILHKVSKFITELFKGYGVILENLKNLRKRVNKGVNRDKFMKFRLSAFPFRRIQFYIQYKSLFNGSPVYFVDPKNTSKICFRCGGTVNSSKYCPKCGLDRDINACLNMLKMWGLPPPESLLNAEMTSIGSKQGRNKGG